MKKIILSVLVFSSSLWSLTWSTDLTQAFSTAKKEHKLVMVMVESSFCRWCKKMKHRTLEDASLEKRLEKYILVKVMRDDAKAIAVLPKVGGVPTIFFMDSEKKVIESVVGYFDVRDFTSYIDDVEKIVQDKVK
jgi:thioredoxin-related protein